ncbi:MAG: hypothetical protein AB7H92_19195, partial [Microbacteriaceae bacterium]
PLNIRRDGTVLSQNTAETTVGDSTMSWIPAEKIYLHLEDGWPSTLQELALWAQEKAPSIYLLLQVREVMENYIRADAFDTTAIENIDDQPGAPTDYTSEPISNKITALRAVNARINQLGLDRPIAVAFDTNED